MKRLRLLLLGAGAGLLVLLALAIVASSSAFQTWAARRAMAARPELKASVGSVSAGAGRTEIRDLRVEHKGVSIWLPLVELEVPVMNSGWKRTVIVTRLTAHGWTMEFPPVQGTALAAVPAPDAQRVSADAAVQAFVGVFAQLELPVDVSINGVDLAGEIVLPEARGRAKVAIKGGGLVAGREAKFDVTATAALVAEDVKSVELRGEVTATMGQPRVFTALGVKLDATATGPGFPNGARLHAVANARRSEAGENYAAMLVSEGREVFSVAVDFPTGARRIDGRWRVQARDADLVPFALGKPMPAFSLTGEGTLDADVGFTAVHLAGRLDATADRLGLLQRELAELGPITLNATFDLAHRGGAIAARKFEASLGAGEPVATVRLLQEFEINPGTGELRTAEVARELLALTLHGAPLAWARPWLEGLDPGRSRVRGELFATPRNGGASLRSRAPLAIDGLTITRGGQPQIESVDLLVSVAADYTPQGWQVEIPGLAAKVGGVTLLTFEARTGRLAGRDQPVKATGRITADLPLLVAQPFAAGRIALSSGELDVNFVTSLAHRREVQASIALKNLSAKADDKTVTLPSIAVDLRVDAMTGGVMTIVAPISIERSGRKSDLAVTGTLAPVEKTPSVIEALVTGTQFFMEDAQVFSALVPRATPRPAGTAPTPGAAASPPWAGINGSITVRLKELIHSETLRVRNITGRVRLDAGMVKLEGLQASVGEAGRANADGTITFDAAAPHRYALAADVRLKDFDSALAWRAFQGDRAAPIEGRFDVTSVFSARARALEALADAATGEFTVTSKSGVFRGLPVSVAQAAESSGRLAGILASIGNLTGRKTGSDIAGKVEAVAEFVRGLHPMPYDQLNFQVTRDATLQSALENFTLIAPELRLTGAGTATHRQGTSLLDDALSMEFRLRARGRQAELLKYLGLLEAKADHLGYTECALAFPVSGTIGQPDTTELNQRFAALALEKSGVTEKASELFNKLIGGGK